MFSCHDIIASPESLVEIFGDSVRGLPYRDDSDGILKWHKAHDITPGVVDTVALFNAIGWTLDVYDLYAARGCEEKKDLNQPFHRERHYRYDFVYDGVLGQVFMAGQCFRSSVELVRKGGYLLSVSVANSPNHGFYSISPTLYRDGLTQNKFEIKSHTVVTDLARTATAHPFAPTTGCDLPYGSCNVVLARRKEAGPFQFPVQSKFLKNPESR